MAIVPAFNEEQTVFDVAAVLVQSGRFREVMVIDDGSHDATVEHAAASGATVVRALKNGGKAEAMQLGLRRWKGDVAFFDADLLGLSYAHLDRMLDAYEMGWDMVCGVFDDGFMANPLRVMGPLITGQRIVRRHVLDAIPESCWKGYSIEVAMNDACERIGGRNCILLLDQLGARHKAGKVGYLRGYFNHAKMYHLCLVVAQSLKLTCGAACQLPRAS